MKKVILYVLCALILVSTVFAASHEVTIDPSNPQDTDDLRCLLDGEANKEYAYVWYVNDKIIEHPNPTNQKDTYILDNSYTNPSDAVTCAVYAITPFGEYSIGHATVTIAEKEQTKWPTVTIIPAEPRDSNDLTCLIDNTIQSPQTTNYAFRWLISNKEVAQSNLVNQKETEILSNELTSVNDIVKCEAYTVTAFGQYEIGKATVTVLADQNTTPINPNITNMCLTPLCNIWNSLVNTFEEITYVNYNPRITIIEPANQDSFNLTQRPIEFVAEVSDKNKDHIDVIWDFNDGTGSTKPADTYTLSRNTVGITHTFSKQGRYIVTATAFDGKGGESQSQIVIFVAEQKQTEQTIIDDNDAPKTSHENECNSKDLDIVSITSLNYKETYNKLDKISLLIKIKNNGCKDEKVTIRFYNMDGTETYWMPDLTVDSIESQTLEYDFIAPSKTGTQLLKVSLAGQEGDYSLAKYFAYTVA